MICNNLHANKLMSICRNVANVFTKWKTIRRFAEFVAKFYKVRNSLKFPNPNTFFVIHFIFSIQAFTAVPSQPGRRMRPPQPWRRRRGPRAGTCCPDGTLHDRLLFKETYLPKRLSHLLNVLKMFALKLRRFETFQNDFVRIW